MPLAVAFENVIQTRQRKEGEPAKGTTGAVSTTAFFRDKDAPDFPHAVLSERDAGRYSSTHFHRVDQAQVTVAGHGKIGRHELAPYSIHFSRAYTPYGPLLSEEPDGLSFFVMRARYDPGSQRIPKEMAQLQQVPNRQPFQVSRAVTFPEQTSSGNPSVLEAVQGFKDDRGLAAYTLSMGPNAKSVGPGHSGGAGQYYVIVKGSLWHDNKEHKAWGLVFVWPKDGPFEIRAGAEGLQAIIINFPIPSANFVDHVVVPNKGAKVMQCPVCGFQYDEAAGLPHEGIPAGTPWNKLPDNWNCPDCAAVKGDFEMVE